MAPTAEVEGPAETAAEHDCREIAGDGTAITSEQIGQEGRSKPLSWSRCEALGLQTGRRGTRVTFRGDPNPVGVLKRLSPLVARQAQRLWDGNLARLKTVLDGSAP